MCNRVLSRLPKVKQCEVANSNTVYEQLVMQQRSLMKLLQAKYFKVNLICRM